MIGVIGGSGLELFPELDVVDRVKIKTRYGRPSDVITIAQRNGQLFAFLPRHGSKHHLPPHRIPYRANIAAFKKLGIKTVIGTCIVGSLKRKLVPGSFVIPEQFVNMTWGRDDVGTSSNFIHLPMAEPYCACLRRELSKVALSEKVVACRAGTVVVIQGPRFSTIAESRFFIRNGWDIVNMTQYPECYYAREAGLCYAALAAVTDWDVGVRSNMSIVPSNMDRVLAIFKENVSKTKNMVLKAVDRLASFECGCASTAVIEYYKQ